MLVWCLKNLNPDKFRYFKIALAFFLTYAFVFTFYCAYFSLKESSFSEKDNIIIDYPKDPDDVAKAFINRGISSNVFMTKFVIKICNICGYKLKFGEYHLPDKVSLLKAIQIISFGKQVVHKFCIPEGLSVAQTIERLKKNAFLQGDIREIPEEGSLLPETYCFRYPETRQGIINQAKKAMENFIEKEWKNRSADCFLKTPKEAIILASIVEKESSIQQNTVAGMYLNRLRKNMKLQSDPTVVYSLTRGKKFSRRLTYSDLKRDDPYNTYKVYGLPPLPIANPGKQAILGVLHPQKTDWLYIYFDSSVSQPVYAKTYQEHKRNIARIRQIDISKVK